MKLINMFKDACFPNALFNPPEVDYEPAVAVLLFLVGVLPDVWIKAILKDHVVGLNVSLDDLTSILHNRAAHSLHVVLVFELKEGLLLDGERCFVEDVFLHHVLVSFLIPLLIGLSPWWSVVLLVDFHLPAEARLEPLNSD